MTPRVGLINPLPCFVSETSQIGKVIDCARTSLTLFVTKSPHVFAMCFAEWRILPNVVDWLESVYCGYITNTSLSPEECSAVLSATIKASMTSKVRNPFKIILSDGRTIESHPASA